MVDTVPSWLATMRAIDGTLEEPGSADNPVILSWSDTIAHAFPDMATYAGKVKVSRFAKSGINTIRRPPSPTAGAQSAMKPVPAGSTSGRFHSLIGGYYSSTPMDKSSGPVAIRMNNPGAINGAAWERAYPGYVSEVETTPGNRSTIFETPEHGVAAWYE